MIDRFGVWPLILALVVIIWAIGLAILLEIFRYLGQAGQLFDEGVAQALEDLDAARERDRVDVSEGWRWES